MSEIRKRNNRKDRNVFSTTPPPFNILNESTRKNKIVGIGGDEEIISEKYDKGIFFVSRLLSC